MAAEFGRLAVLCFTLVLSGSFGLWIALPDVRAETAETNQAKPGPRADPLPNLWAGGTINLAANLPRGVKSSREAQAIELAFWEAIKTSKNPEDYEAYLEAFPNGAFVPLARARIRQYSKKAEPAAPKVTEPAPAKPATVPEPEPPKQAQPASPAIRAVEGRFIVVKNANVRTRPSPNAPRMATVPSGRRIGVTGRVVGQDWYQIKTEDGRVGFIYGPLVGRVAQEPSVAKKPAAPAPEAPQVAAKTPKVFRDCSSCPEMVELGSGSFMMGTNGGDVVEAPTRRVSIGAVAIGRYEVTVAQWMVCVAAGGCSYKPKSSGKPDRMAVRNISWNDTQEYLRWLKKVTGKSYRLPSEAEWEYAARGGSNRSYWWGDRVEARMAGCKDCGGPWSRKSPREIGSFPSNSFGLHDVSGGVAEWTADCWYANYRGAPRDGSPRIRSDCRQRVLRGGAWRHTTSYLRSAARLPYDADVRYLAHGFRVAAPLN